MRREKKHPLFLLLFLLRLTLRRRTSQCRVSPLFDKKQDSLCEQKMVTTLPQRTKRNLNQYFRQRSRVNDAAVRACIICRNLPQKRLLRLLSHSLHSQTRREK